MFPSLFVCLCVFQQQQKMNRIHIQLAFSPNLFHRTVLFESSFFVRNNFFHWLSISIGFFLFIYIDLFCFIFLNYKKELFIFIPTHFFCLHTIYKHYLFTFFSLRLLLLLGILLQSSSVCVFLPLFLSFSHTFGS